MMLFIGLRWRHAYAMSHHGGILNRRQCGRFLSALLSYCLRHIYENIHSHTFLFWKTCTKWKISEKNQANNLIIKTKSLLMLIRLNCVQNAQTLKLGLHLFSDDSQTGNLISLRIYEGIRQINTAKFADEFFLYRRLRELPIEFQANTRTKKK